MLVKSGGGGSKTVILDFWRADLQQFKTLVRRVHWEFVLKGRGIQKG